MGKDKCRGCRRKRVGQLSELITYCCCATASKGVSKSKDNVCEKVHVKEGRVKYVWDSSLAIAWLAKQSEGKSCREESGVK
jgi:hypothetical protein